MKRSKVLIVDDHLVVRDGLKLIFETEEYYEVVGEAENGEKALKLIEQLKPDVILMDLSMPKMNGIDAIKALNEKKNKIPIIILTTFNEGNLMKQGLALGAKGYLLKDTTRENIIRTIESALRGEILLQPEISDKIFKSTEKQSKSNDSLNPIVTEKELFVLQAIARGYRSKEIAFDMDISERTVKAHLTNIYAKLKVDSRAEAVAVAIKQGIIHIYK